MKSTNLLYNISDANALSIKRDQASREADSGHSTEDSMISSVQASTRALIDAFGEKTRLLTNNSDLKLLLREGYKVDLARQTAEKFFGKMKVSFVAIDGTESQDQHLDMLIFYAGAFGYVGQLDFLDAGCDCGEVTEAKRTSNISTAIPLFEGDVSNIVGRETEAGMEIEAERLPSVLMQFAEYYLATRLLLDDPNLRIVILDRTLAGDLGHLIWSVSELVRQKRCMLQGLQTEFGIVSAFDLELARMIHPNTKLGIPSPRSQFIKYSAIDFMLSKLRESKSSDMMSYEVILNKIGANPSRIGKLINDVTSLHQEYSILSKEDGSLAIKPEFDRYWERVLSATLMVAQHIFETPVGEHPLIYEVSRQSSENGNEVKPVKKWITSADIEYLTLVMIYGLLRQAWERDILVIGLVKDTNASELIRSVTPILQDAGKINLTSQLPSFSSDKQLLQTFSVIRGNSIKTPWRTFEFDACFRTMAPSNEERDHSINTKVKGAYKNVISGERVFLKSYVQLWHSENDDSVRSHVFSYDRPCYPDWDEANELVLNHFDGNVKEDIRPMIHFTKDSDMTHLTMDILCSMANEVIPECLGHNYPLFLADKKAKYILDQMKTAYLSAVAFEMANSEFDQQVLFQARFRDFRSQIESSRRFKK